MSAIVAQLGVLARGPNLENWTDLLVVVVMAVLWLAAGLVKAISKKKSGQQDEQAGMARQQQRPPRESWQVRLARKAEEMQRAIEQGERPRSAPAPVARSPQPPASRITIRQDPRGESIMVYERAEPPAVQPAAQREHQAARQRQAGEAVAAAGRAARKEPAPVEPKVEIKSAVLEPIAGGLPDIALEPRQPSEPDKQKTEVSREAAGLESATLLDSSDSDAIRKAILHYEILGVPLALREPFD